MAAQSGEKTEKPTARRLQKAREQGQFLSSREFVAGIQFVIFVMMLGSLGRPWMIEARKVMGMVIRQAFKPDLNGGETLQLAGVALVHLLQPLGMAALLLAVVTIGIQFLTTKGGLSLGKLKPSLNRLKPMAR
jgi:type III secretion protein U